MTSPHCNKLQGQYMKRYLPVVFSREMPLVVPTRKRQIVIKILSEIAQHAALHDTIRDAILTCARKPT